MNERRFFLYDSQDKFCNDILEELKNNNLLSTFQLIDKNNVNNKLHSVIKECLVKCELPTLIIPNINVPIEKNNVKGWIKSIALFNVKTNSIKTKTTIINDPSPQDKYAIPKQEIKKISDPYTFIDDKNTDKLFYKTNR